MSIILLYWQYYRIIFRIKIKFRILLKYRMEFWHILKIHENQGNQGI